MNELEDKHILENTKMIPQGGGDYVSLQYHLPGKAEPTNSNPVKRSDLKASVLTSWCNSLREIVKAEEKEERSKREKAKKARKVEEYSSTITNWLTYPVKARVAPGNQLEAASAARALAELTSKNHPLVIEFHAVTVEEGVTPATPEGSTAAAAVTREEMDELKISVATGFDEIKKLIMESKP